MSTIKMVKTIKERINKHNERTKENEVKSFYKISIHLSQKANKIYKMY